MTTSLKRDFSAFMKTLISLIVIVGCSHAVSAQTDVSIEYNAQSQLVVNAVTVTNTTTAADLIAVVGEATRTEVSSNGETGYFYDGVGFMFIVKEGTVSGLGINYNWDGDVKFPKTSYTGSLLLGELSVTKETTHDQIAGIQNVSFSCPIPLMCASTDKTAAVKCMVSFMEGKISQVVYLIS